MELWSHFQNKVDYLIKSEDSINKKLLLWTELKALINNKKYIPSHFGNLFLFESKVKNYSKHIKILDHGCGSGLSLLFLILKGYENIWGVTVNFSNDIKNKNKVKKINQLIKILLNLKSSSEDRIKFYDGKTLPFKKKTFDFIYSQQVFEHLDRKYKNFFLLEEGKVLKDNGLLYHQIPHRLVPYEAHTKTWIIHWLPKNLQKIYFRKKSYKLNFIDKHLFLDWPWEIRAFLKNHSMEYENITYKRLSKIKHTTELKGISLIVRKIISFIFAFPLIGNLIIRLLAIFFMIEIFVSKDKRNGAASRI